MIARFEAERQALALMDHPNIAQVFEGDATPSGRPYFVMELVRGLPITHFCDQNHYAITLRGLRVLCGLCVSKLESQRPPKTQRPATLVYSRRTR